MTNKFWLRCGLVVCGVLLTATAQANFPSVPQETYQALNLDRSASPKEFHEALTKRYLDPGRGAGKGQYGQYWEPLPFSKYLDPLTFYKPPTTVKDVATREQCVKCHTDESPGWVALWKKSVHANLDKIRKLTPKDDTFYKKAKLEEVETNLRSLGKLGATESLKEVGCIDCHVDINTKKKADHRADIKMPTSDVCGNCHLQEYAERESERDTILWPKNQWPRGRPSHALDYRANVETEIYAGMAQREIADGCTMCHTNQNKCDNCHTRHEFSVANSRKPEACGTCHSGADHNNWEAYNGSQHGLGYQASKDQWNWNIQLKDAVAKGGQRFPTCQSCHMEYQGKFSHNVVRKVRWANYPFVPGIREPVFGEWMRGSRPAPGATPSALPAHTWSLWTTAPPRDSINTMRRTTLSVSSTTRDSSPVRGTTGLLLQRRLKACSISFTRYTGRRITTLQRSSSNSSKWLRTIWCNCT
jgi:hydroxylamine dehydrogenase